MEGVLFLYDTNETDLARDFKDFLAEFNVNLVLIPLAPDQGHTLEGKEKEYLDSARGAIFLLTPGSERSGSSYPSPSVNHEMGQIKRRFEDNKKAVIYLLDDGCKPPAIDQKAYILFNRHDMRSIIYAITHLLKNMKEAGFIPNTTTVTQIRHYSSTEIMPVFKRLSEKNKSVLFALSLEKDGSMDKDRFTELLSETFSLKMHEVNFLRMDLLKDNFIKESVYHVYLTDLGWEIAKRQNNKKKISRSILGL